MLRLIDILSPLPITTQLELATEYTEWSHGSINLQYGKRCNVSSPVPLSSQINKEDGGTWIFCPLSITGQAEAQPMGGPDRCRMLTGFAKGCLGQTMLTAPSSCRLLTVHTTTELCQQLPYHDSRRTGTWALAFLCNEQVTQQETVGGKKTVVFQQPGALEDMKYQDLHASMQASVSYFS